MILELLERKSPARNAGLGTGQEVWVGRSATPGRLFCRNDVWPGVGLSVSLVLAGREELR